MSQARDTLRLEDWRTQETEAGLIQSRFRVMTRPATPFEMMDDAIAIYRERFVPLMRISLWLYIIPALVSLFTIVPVALLESSAGGSARMGDTQMLTFTLVEYGSLCLIYPFLLAAPMLQSAATTAALPFILEGKPISLKFVWELIKPRFWHLVANQLLATMALSMVYVVVGLAFVLFFFFLAFGIAQLSLPATLSVVALVTFGLLFTFLGLVALAAGSVWFILLPQIIILEPNTDAISAFSRAYDLVRANFRHALISCLAFWGLQTVVYFAIYSAVLLLLGILVLILSFVYDLQSLLERWALTGIQLIDPLSYFGFILVMPAMYLTSILLYYDLRYRREGLDIQQLVGREVDL
ncbi:MAG: hypothetical protein SNJ72_02605 [Fimbriimonadales bacterium]